MSQSTFHIVYPKGDKKKLSVVEICSGLEYELYDYSVASRKSFYDKADCVVYAKDLANKNNLEYIGSRDEPDYLD